MHEANNTSEGGVA